jgi:hypothetical protein
MVAMDPEELLIGEIGGARHVARSVDHDVAVHVQHVDAAEISRRRRAVEQHLAAQRHRQPDDLRLAFAVDDRLQRQRIDLDVALDVPRGHQREVLQRDACAVARVDPGFVEHDAAQQQQ